MFLLTPEFSCHNITEHSDPDPEVSGPDLMVVNLMMVRQVHMSTVVVTVMIRLSEMEMTIISVRYFVPHLVLKHLKTDKCLCMHIFFSLLFYSVTLNK
jgi:ABC-type uncharacterized transport system permease subunit